MTAPAEPTVPRVRRFGVGLYTGQKDGGADYSDAASGVVVDLAAGTASGDATVGNDTLDGIENVIGGAGDDTLTGDGNANVIGLHGISFGCSVYRSFRLRSMGQYI